MKKVQESKKRISFFRLYIALVICVYFSLYLYSKFKQQSVFTPEVLTDPWFASYVDVTAKPTYSFEQEPYDAVLAFIVSSTEDPCIPTWGTYYDMENASVELDLDRRIARLRQQNRSIAISFGGVINDELATKCEDEEKLYSAYKSVIDRYFIDTIDMDLENENLRDLEAGKRRAKVLARIQNERRSNNLNLAIWVTLPVAPQGLTKDGTDAVSVMLENGVDLAGVNVMTMNYGGSREDKQSMYDASKNALMETHRQLGILYNRSGKFLSSESLWRKIGATPMIGQNDISNEVFTVGDAKELNNFTLEKNIGRMSMWSANRDIKCGENYVDVRVVSDSCSGVNADKGAFAEALGADFVGNLSDNSANITLEESVPTAQVVDLPDSSPYQIWKPTGAYPKGVKVVWRGNVYEAKWWTKNDLPDNPVLQYWETPWKLVGPVLPGETPIKQLTLPRGTYPNWSGQVIYEGGERVLFDGIPFQAKWWNEGESPAASAANPDNSPWIPLTQKQIEEILGETE